MNGYIVEYISRNQTEAINKLNGKIVDISKIKVSYKEALKRKKELDSYMSNFSKKEGNSNIILKVENNKITIKEKK